MMLKKMVLITVSLVTLLLTGCSFDHRYKREANGNEDYLNTTELEVLKLSQGFRLPQQDDKYLIYNPRTKGDIGLNVDILPPALPLATLDGSYANYSRGIAVLDMPATYGVWGKIMALLKSKKIVMKSEKVNEIQVSDVVINVSAREIPYKASYRISLKKMASRQLIYIELLSLFANKKDILNNQMERQRYTVDFFNMIMLELKKNELVSNTKTKINQ